jgi:hypothetical protein
VETLLTEIGPLLLYGSLLLLLLVGVNRSTSGALVRKLRIEFALVADEMGLAVVSGEQDKEIVLAGMREGIPVEARIDLRGARTGRVIARPPGLSSEIRLVDSFERQKLGPLEGLQDYKIGDARFDSLLVLQGPRPDLYAALTADARTALTAVVANDGFRLEGGQLKLDLTARDGAWLRTNFASLLRVARYFVMEETRAARFLSNFQAEKNPQVAVHNAVHLLREEPGSPEASRVSDLLLSEGLERFARFASGPEWPGLLAVLLMRCPDAASAVVGAFLERELYPASKVNLPGLAAIALALGGSDTDSARQSLWRIVHEGLANSVQIVALQSLGRNGGVEDVEPLLELPTGLFDGQLKSAIDAAVTAIQSRLEGGPSGGLALTEDALGQGDLSLARTEGALSEPSGSDDS